MLRAFTNLGGVTSLMGSMSLGAPTAVAAAAPVRNMATLKDLKLRISATGNISKITKSMKMIASTKLNRAQREMVIARKYGDSVNAFYKHADTKVAEKEGNVLYIAVSSDKGLCGGVHSYVARKIRDLAVPNPNASVVSLGDKAKMQLSRTVADKIVFTVSSLGAKPPSYLDACLIADELLKHTDKFDSINIVYNRFQSAISYATEPTPAYTLENVLASTNIDQYETEDDTLQNLVEFNLANQIYTAMVDGFASETSSKMAAMDNATKNAGELIGKLTIVYNRSRQAAITTELVDIITGASAL